jgi:transposase
MSLPRPPVQRSIFDVQNLIGRDFDPDDRFRLFQEKIYPTLLAAREELAACYCADNGRPAEEPVMLLGATILQFMERLPDRQASEAVSYHLGWKLALGLGLSPQTFHPTTLCKFRARLLQHKKAKLAFDAVLHGLIDVGLVSRRSRQRLDSTHVLGLVAKMSSLELVRETMRLAMLELSRAMAALPDANRPALPAAWPAWWERYVESKIDYRTEEVALAEKLRDAGADVQQLLQWVDALVRPEGPEELAALAAGKQVTLLRRVFAENYDPVPSVTPPAADAAAPAAPTVKPKGAQPTGAVKNPHDPDSHWSNKKAKAKSPADEPGAPVPKASDTGWIGYKVQVAETVQEEPRAEGEPTLSFLTSVETQPSTHSDHAGLQVTLAAQQESGLLPPSELYVDTAYVAAKAIRQATEEGRELVGPAFPAVNHGKELKSDAFDVDVANRLAICPAGHANTNCSRLEEKSTGIVTYRYEWGGKRGPCADCPLKSKCVSKGQSHRTLLVGEDHAYLQQRRREMETEEFKQRMKHRNAIEGTMSEMARGHGLRRARYRGLPKVRLQNSVIGAACNAKRWIRRAAWEIKQAAKNAAAAVVGALRPEEAAPATA